MLQSIHGSFLPTHLPEEPKNIIYHGHPSKVTNSIDSPQVGCYYCNSIRGSRDNANIERYIVTTAGS